jgi:PAS domain S-box-containing protein
MTLHVLQVEDSEGDAALVVRALQKGGLDVAVGRVEDAASLRNALQSRVWDAIICDYRLPGFDAPAAFAIVKESGLDIPFIVVSGTMGEDRAVAMMKEGVHDYLMKSHLERLAPAVEREINEAKIRRDHRRATQALVESEARFKSLFQSDVVGIFVGDARTILEANSHFLRLLGYSDEDLSNKTIPYKHTKPAVSSQRGKAGVFLSVEHGVCTASEYTWTRKNGTEISVLAGGVSIRVSPDEQFIGFVVDLTDRVRLQRQLLQSQKLEGLGRLAAGVAHDFNNLLTVISGYSNMLRGDIGLSGMQRESVEGVIEAATHAQTLTRQLLAFGRKQIAEPKPIYLNDVIRDFQQLLERIIGEDVVLEVKLAPATGRIQADPGHMEQVIMNLALNARDAMAANGTLQIETRRRRIGQDDSEAQDGMPPGEYVELSVRDTGAGMPPEILSQIFEPFFTTKEAGRGTGLGLSTVYGIVKQSGGSIRVFSKPEEGTLFVILFPVIVQGAAGPAPTVAGQEPIAGSETVLLVDDDEPVRRFLRKVLTDNGYEVLEAANGRVALTHVRAAGHAIRIVVCDAVMPEMGGKELAERCREILPGVPFIAMSGYSDIACGEENWAVGYLAKPFSANALLAIIRGILDAK